MVGNWFHNAADFATTWLPLAFFAILVLTAWLLWKTVGMMPRVRPTQIDLKSKSRVTWMVNGMLSPPSPLADRRLDRLRNRTGVLLGLLAEGLLTRGLAGLLFHVSPVDPATLAAAAAGLLLTAALASWIPARRAAAVDPANALRAE